MAAPGSKVCTTAYNKIVHTHNCVVTKQSQTNDDEGEKEQTHDQPFVTSPDHTENSFEGIPHEVETILWATIIKEEIQWFVRY